MEKTACRKDVDDCAGSGPKDLYESTSSASIQDRGPEGQEPLTTITSAPKVGVAPLGKVLALHGPANLPVTALVLAGSRGGPDLIAQSEGVTHKALARVGETTMIERVLVALREAGVRRLLVSTDVPAVIAIVEAAGVEVIEPGPGPSESVARGLEIAGAPLLVTTADHPLLSPEWIRSFITGSPKTADIAIMLARRQDVESAVPGSQRTWLRFADGGWSGCNLFLLATAEARQAVDQWRMVESERKRPWRIAARLGWRTLFDYGLGRLAMADAIGRVGTRMGVSAALVPATHGMAAVDVDTIDDLAVVRTILGASEPREALAGVV